MNSVIIVRRGHKRFSLTGLCCAATAFLLALTVLSAWPEAAQAQNAEGYPSIAGVPRVGQTLTADASMISDANGLGTFSYQWFERATGPGTEEAAISGATGSSYTIQAAQLGKRLKVKVSFTDGESNEEMRESLETPAVQAATATNQRPEGNLTITNLAEWPDTPLTSRDNSDDIRVGDWLAEFGGSIEDPDGNGNLRTARESHHNYSWLADGAVVAPAVRAFRVTSAMWGTTITLRLRFTDSEGVVEHATSFAYGPVRWRLSATGLPTISGRYRVDDTLTAGTSELDDRDGIERTSLTYQWLADDVAIANAMGATYTLTGSEQNKRIKVRVNFNDGAGDTETLTSTATTVVRAAATQNQPATGTLSISGARRPGSTLIATPQVSDPDGTTLAQFSYQWLADNAVISGATGTTYRVRDTDAGKRISVRLTFTDDGGSVETITSAQTEAVRVGTAPTGRPEISGRLRVGDTLTANTGGISDPDGVDASTFTYQWLGNDTAIVNATSRTYALAAAQLGQRIKVRVTFTDRVNAQETVTSLATSAVVAAETANQAPTGLPTISGTANAGGTLTANTGGIADADGLTGVHYSYKWLASDTVISGETGRTYTVRSSDAGKSIKVRVSFTDNLGSVETLTSAATATVPSVANNGDIRLDRDGRLYMFQGSEWGTVCRDGLYGLPAGDRAAQVVCRQLGRSGGTLLPHTALGYYPFSGPDVLFDRMVCTGMENRLGDCSFRRSTNIPCDHSEDVAVSCGVPENTAAVAVSFRQANSTAVEGGRGTLVAVDVNPAPNGRLSIPITAIGEGGAHGGDFTISSATLTFNSGQTAKNVTVTAVDDAVDDDGESVTLDFGELPAGVTAGSAVTVSLEDNDVRAVTVSKTALTMTEGDSGSYTVVLATEPTAAVTVSVTNDLADTGLQVAPSSLTFTSTSWSVRQTVMVSSAKDQDAVVEPAVILAHAAAGGDYEGLAVAGVTVTVTETVQEAATGRPEIAGRHRVGDTLSAGTGSIDDPNGVDASTFTYQWLGNDTAIANATSMVYALAPAQLGQRIKVSVTFTDGAGAQETVTSLATSAVVAAGTANRAPTGLPTISGTANVGDALTANTGNIADADGLTGVRYSYQWLAGDTVISGEIGRTYAVRSSDGGKSIKVRVSFTDNLGSVETLTSAATATVPPLANDGDIQLNRDGRLFMFQRGEWGTVCRDGLYGLPAGDRAAQVVCRQLGRAGGTVLPHTALGYHPGPPDVLFDRLVCTGAENRLGDCSFRRSTNIPCDHSEDFAVSCSGETTPPVVNRPPTGLPTTTGAARVGQTLTVDTSGISDPDGPENLVFTYQWLADGDAIPSATAMTYTVMTSDVGKAVAVQVSFTDGADNDETLTSAATEVTAARSTETVTVSFRPADPIPAAEEGRSGALVVVTVSPAPNGPLSIPVTATGGGGAQAGDFTISPVMLMFKSGETAKNVTVTAVDDAVDDDGETVTLGFGRLPANASTVGALQTKFTVRLTDNDARDVKVSRETLTVAEGGSGTYTVVLMSEPTAAVTVSMTTDLAATALDVAPSSLTFTSTSWSVPQTVRVNAAEDNNALVEPVVTLAHAAVGGDYEALAVAGVAVTVTENDRPALAIGDARGGENVGVLEFEVGLSTASSETVTVNYATADRTATAGSDYTATSGVLTFAPGHTDAQTVEVQITDDAVDEDVEAETFTVTLSGAANATLQDATATGTIDDDDVPAVTVAFGAASYTAVEGGGGAVVAVTLSADPERPVEILLTAVEGGDAEEGDYTLSATSLTFDSGVTAREVTVTAADDAVDDDGETVTLGFGQLPAGVTAGSAVTVALEDNDARGVTVSRETLTVAEGGSGTYTVVLTSEPTAAVTVSMTTDLADTGLEVAPSSLTFTSTSWSVAQMVTVRATEDNNAAVEPVVTLAHAAAGGDYEGAHGAGIEVTVLENDSPTLAIGDAKGGEDAGVLEFVVSLSTASSETVTVNYATADRTATAGSDYTAMSGVLTFAPGNTDAQTIEVQITDDAVDEDVEAETFTVTLSGAANAEVAVQSAIGTIDDNDVPVVTVAFGAARYTAAEGGDGAVVAVTLSADPERPVEILLTAVEGGDAEEGDYTLSATSLTFDSGVTAREVTVTAADDAVDDDGETVTLGFGPLPAGLTMGSLTAAVVALEDDDEREVRVLPASLTVTEGGAAENYTVVLGSRPTAAVTVSMTTDLADSTVLVDPASLTFTAENWSTAQSVAVSAVEDNNAAVEPVVTLAHAAAGGDYEGAHGAGIEVTVLENDTPTLAISDAKGGEDAGVLEFVVSLSTASSETVTVNYATADRTATAGSDYTATSGVLTFAPGNTDAQTIEVQITDDAVDEDVEAETFTVTLSGAANATLQDATATGTIDDDDVPAVTVAFGAASYTAVEGGGGAVVAVTLSADPERPVEILLTAVEGGGAEEGDYTLSATSLTFDSGVTAREVTVTAADDAVDDDGETVTLGFGPLPAGVTAGSAVTVALEDNDARGVTVSRETLTVAEGGSSTYTVVLTSEPTAAVTVSMTTDLADSTVLVDPASLTFTAENWSTAQSVAVSAVEDNDVLAPPVLILMHMASGGDYSGVPVSGVAVTVLENDVPTLGASDARGVEGAGGLSFVVSLSAASSDVVTVAYATVDGTAVAGADYTPVSGRLTFAPGAAGSQTIVVQLTDDAEPDGEETFTLVLSGETNAVLGKASATGTIVDDDEPNTPPAAVGAIEEQILTVGGADVRVNVSDAFADAEDDQLTYTAETANAEVATVSVAGAVLTLAPAGIGRTSVTVTASDSNAEATQRFVVVVGTVVSDAVLVPAADGGAVVMFTVPEAPTVRIEIPGGVDALDTDGDGDVDGQDELPIVRAVSMTEVPAVPASLRVRVDTESAVDIEVPEHLTANGASVRVCLATSLDSETLALYRYDAEAQEWLSLESAVERRGQQQFVCAEVGDFSIFAVFEESSTQVSVADINGNGRLDGDDALVMYYAYGLESLLGDGETGGVSRFRRVLLAGLAGTPDPSDAELMTMLRRANEWDEVGADAGGDINGNGRIDGDDALVMYYAYELGSLLGDGETGGVSRFRRVLLAGLAGAPDPSDAELMAMLRRANGLREHFR